MKGVSLYELNLSTCGAVQAHINGAPAGQRVNYTSLCEENSHTYHEINVQLGDDTSR